MKKKIAYEYLYSEIKKDIQDGKYKNGALIPTEKELEEKFSVSRTTVRKAISMLASEGYLGVKQGYGTFVLDYPTAQNLNKITSITETLQARGRKIDTKDTQISIVVPPELIALKLNLDEGETVYMVERIKYLDGKPLAFMVNYLKKDELPDLEKFNGKFDSLYKFLTDTYKIELTEADESLSAVAATFIESQILDVPVNSPLLCSKRISYTKKGPFEYAISKLLSDKYEYNVHLLGR
ncbi:GntR family transcriptional regulator [Vagococcus fluvialis]|uniref:GntR family transcriptional regulator n=1 Tax=Vagococcus fluvialis TaxID=2738 RepID=UPI00288CB472|nr:GntR family transcriptional regulator [Vagococcus fluvialis]MDT2782989.1 GntR family transcriptional regulator [Vagococcus fluvialis]